MTGGHVKPGSTVINNYSVEFTGYTARRERSSSRFLTEILLMGRKESNQTNKSSRFPKIFLAK